MNANQAAELWFPSPAKINLFLHITGQRENGYHDLQTVFQLLDFGDRLQFEVNDSGLVRLLDNLTDVDEQNNLIVKAAQILKQQSQFGQSKGVDIRLDKRLPMGAGLAGGSSNAATTLLALNKLWGFDFSIEELAGMGLTLGADVPVFVRGRSAWGEGVGDQLQAIELPEKWYAIVYPGVAISTQDIFLEKELTRDCIPIRIRDFELSETQNVCEQIARQKFPAVAEAIDFLSSSSNPELVRMTGTGSSIFAQFSTENEARLALKGLSESWLGIVTKGVNISPICATIHGLHENAC